MKMQIIELLQKLNRRASGRFIESDIEEYVEKILSRATLLTSISNNHLEAFIAYYNNDEKKEMAYLTVLAVDPSCQGMGLGSRLLKFSIEDLQKKGFKYYELEVSKENQNAMNMYEKMGFAISTENEKSFFMKRKLI